MSPVHYQGCFAILKTMSIIPLKLYNTETKSKETFTPRSVHSDVTIYTCGPTVYDYAHVGNLRAYVFADVLKRVLIYNGYPVRHTINYTDFGHLTSDADTGDDKMMKGLKREGMEISLAAMRQLSDRYIEAFNKDFFALNCLPPTQFARASDYVEEQKKLVTTLTQKGYAYETSDGLYFDIAKFPGYGRLGQIDLKGQQSAERTNTNPEKHQPADFALWKKGELGWDSPWGLGFPGWHIECSAMAMATLGETIDIHTGGVDNIPTHHNGELAQSEAATGQTFARYWLHAEHVQLSGQKLAKSDGSGLFLRDLYAKGFNGTDYRYLLLSAHYRSKLEFTFEALEAAKEALTGLKRRIFIDWAEAEGKVNRDYKQTFLKAINDDLNTPQALAVLWEVIHDKTLTDGQKRASLLDFDTVLGLGLDIDPTVGRAELGELAPEDWPTDLKELITLRAAARARRDFAEADRLRAKAKQNGFLLEDTDSGTRVSRVSP